jgi:hypothetical protein
MRSLIAALAVILSAAGPLPPADEASSGVLVQGVLLDWNGAPVAAAVLHVAALDASGRAFVEVRGSQILSPTGSADTEGRFSIVVPVSFFASGAAFTVGIAHSDAGIPLGVDRLSLAPVLRNGVPTSFLYPSKRHVVELGEVLAPAG